MVNGNGFIGFTEIATFTTQILTRVSRSKLDIPVRRVILETGVIGNDHRQ